MCLRLMPFGECLGAKAVGLMFQTDVLDCLLAIVANWQVVCFTCIVHGFS